MKRDARALLFGAVLVTLVSVPTFASDAQAKGRFAIGGYAGYQWPVVQDDADPGALFGFKGKMALAPMIEIEPNVTWIQNGDTQTESGGEVPAPDVISFALNANLSFGAMFNLTGGLGWASLDLPNTGALNKFAWNAGFGLEIPVGPVAIDISPRLLVIVTESGASRKHGLIMAGLNYRF